MKIFRIIVLLLSFHSCIIYGQENYPDTLFIKDAIKQANGKRFYYLDTCYSWNRISAQLSKRKFNGRTKQTEQNSIRLSRLEAKFLKEQLEVNKSYIWRDSLFNNAIRIPNDDSRAFLTKHNVLRKEKINAALLNHDTTAAQQISLKEKTWLYEMSKPIFFRENSFCLFYYAAFCDISAGYDETCFYKKENDRWIKWIVISMGDF